MSMDSHPLERPSYFATVAESYDRLQPILAGPSYSKGLDMIVAHASRTYRACTTPRRLLHPPRRDVVKVTMRRTTSSTP